MEAKGVDTEAIIESIDDLIVKTMITAQPSLWQVYNLLEDMRWKWKRMRSIIIDLIFSKY